MKTISKLLLLLLITSCTKEEITVGLSIDFVYYIDNNSEEPTTATITTDKGLFEFDLINETGGGSSDMISIIPNTYKVLDVTLYSDDGRALYYVMEQPTGDGLGLQPTSWVGEYHTLESDSVMIWNVLEIK